MARGELLVDASLAGRMAGMLRSGSAPSPALPDLSPRELEVLTLVARGLRNIDIARQLFVAEKTVRNNVTSLLAKTGAATRPALVALARDVGIA